MHVSGTEQFRQFPAVLGSLPQEVPKRFRAVSGSRIRKCSIKKGTILPQKVLGGFGNFGQHSWAFLGSSFGHPWEGVMGIPKEQF